jgi:anti-anti-sigma regulatory factor
MTSEERRAPAGEAEPYTLVLDGSGDLSAAHRLLAAARECAAANGDVVVDCAAVERFDGASIQVLLALKAKLESSGRVLHMGSMPADCFSFLLATGVAQAFVTGARAP